MDRKFSFDRAASFYDQTRSLPNQIGKIVTESLVETLSATPGTQFLEIGCGTGRISLPIINKGFPCVGLDLSRLMLLQFKKKLSGDSNLIQGDAIDLPFAKNSFDIVVAVRVFHLITNWRTILKEIKRVLKPDGTFCFIGARKATSETLSLKVLTQLRKFASENSIATATPGIKSDKEIITQIIELNGYEDKSVMPIMWYSDISLKFLLDRIANHVYEDTWQMNQKEHEEIMSSLRNWALDVYGTLEIVEKVQNTIHWRVFKFTNSQS